MSSSQAKLKQNGPNYVAINQDWEQRVRSENEAAKVKFEIIKCHVFKFDSTFIALMFYFILFWKT